MGEKWREAEGGGAWGSRSGVHRLMRCLQVRRSFGRNSAPGVPVICGQGLLYLVERGDSGLSLLPLKSSRVSRPFSQIRGARSDSKGASLWTALIWEAMHGNDAPPQESLELHRLPWDDEDYSVSTLFQLKDGKAFEACGLHKNAGENASGRKRGQQGLQRQPPTGRFRPRETRRCLPRSRQERRLPPGGSLSGSRHSSENQNLDLHPPTPEFLNLKPLRSAHVYLPIMQPPATLLSFLLLPAPVKFQQTDMN
jgi:hypothetical protein